VSVFLLFHWRKRFRPVNYGGGEGVGGWELGNITLEGGKDDENGLLA